jgi:hypothetical protein
MESGGEKRRHELRKNGVVRRNCGRERNIEGECRTNVC